MKPTGACPQFKYEVFLQGSYKNDTNLGGDSDVDVVVRLSIEAEAQRWPALPGSGYRRMVPTGSYTEQWKSFRDEALKAMRARFGRAAEERPQDT